VTRGSSIDNDQTTIGREGAGPSDTIEGRLLFVYGALRRGRELHHHLKRVGGRFLGEGKVAAVLFRRQRYPGARPSKQRGAWIPGEVFRLPAEPYALKVLDKVEGFIPGTPARSPFVRRQTAIERADGTRVQAWIYWLGGKRRGLHG